MFKFIFESDFGYLTEKTGFFPKDEKKMKGWVRRLLSGAPDYEAFTRCSGKFNLWENYGGVAGWCVDFLEI